MESGSTLYGEAACSLTNLQGDGSLHSRGVAGPPSALQTPPPTRSTGQGAGVSHGPVECCVMLIREPEFGLMGSAQPAPSGRRAQETQAFRERWKNPAPRWPGLS